MVPWYTWIVAAVPIGGGILLYVLGQLRKGRVQEVKATTAEGYIKSEAEKKETEATVAAEVDKAKTNANPDLGRW